MPRGKTKNPARVWEPDINGDPLLSPEAAAKLRRMYENRKPQQKGLDDEGRQVIYQNLRLQVVYPDEFVVWTDTWEKRGKKRTLVRKVLGHAPSYEGLVRLLEKHHAWGSTSIQYRFIHGPDSSLVFL